jgi:hypothetical protein
MKHKMKTAKSEAHASNEKTIGRHKARGFDLSLTMPV